MHELIPFTRDGATTAEYVAVPAVAPAAGPSRLDHGGAAAVPPAALTAWQALAGHASPAPAMGVEPQEAVDQMINGLGGLATGRFTRPDEVADLVLMLAGHRTANITGADFTIDGGLIKTL
ncbi:hypothetical protein SRB17_46380 [Streptomyces sp. RB17]|uniref:hypothetical protein n=1 Tax=Streptomyces sp. RB17 TaxID=2585197 RepID=UPI0013081C72|nr:hypothetical protein [Streptomyces sp. RB17]MQY36636.1 hypothetical protein [Streptomyces sp. RB17]